MQNYKIFPGYAILIPETLAKCYRESDIMG